MKAYSISSNVTVRLPSDIYASFDRDADFEEIVLRVATHNRAVNVRVSESGNAITIERVTFGAYGSTEATKVKNEEASAKIIRETIAEFLGL